MCSISVRDQLSQCQFTSSLPSFQTPQVEVNWLRPISRWSCKHLDSAWPCWWDIMNTVNRVNIKCKCCHPLTIVQNFPLIFWVNTSRLFMSSRYDLEIHCCFLLGQVLAAACDGGLWPKCVLKTRSMGGAVSWWKYVEQTCELLSSWAINVCPSIIKSLWTLHESCVDDGRFRDISSG